MTLRTASLLLALLPGAALAADWAAQPDSTLRFIGSAQGESFEGGFARFDTQLSFDPADLAATHFAVSIELPSADSANSERDELLHGAEFFDSAAQAEARFEASGAEADGEGYLSRGELTLKGVTRPVTLRYRWSASADGAVLEGEATLDRLDFGIGSGEWEDPEMIAREVTVKTRLNLRPR